MRRVAISLRVLGLEFERNRLSVFANADDMRRINPLGRVPSLILDDGEVLIDSAAILDHLDERVGPSRALLPPGGRERRRALQVVALATGIIDKSGAIVYERTLRPADKIHPPWIDRCSTQLAAGLAALETRIAGDGPGSDRLSQPVITTACMMAHLRRLVPEAIQVGDHPALDRLSATCEATQPFRDTVAADDEAMPPRPL